MPLLIDCYNVLRLDMPPQLAGLDEAGLCLALAGNAWSRRYIGRGGSGIVVVCDGMPKPHSVRESPVPEVELRFSGPGRSADDVIIDLVDKDSAPRRLMVVTNDRALGQRVRRRDARTLASDELIRRLAFTPPGAAKAHDSQRPTMDHPLGPEQVRQWMEEFGFDPDVPGPERRDPNWPPRGTKRK